MARSLEKQVHTCRRKDLTKKNSSAKGTQAVYTCCVCNALWTLQYNKNFRLISIERDGVKQ